MESTGVANEISLADLHNRSCCDGGFFILDPAYAVFRKARSQYAELRQDQAMPQSGIYVAAENAILPRHPGAAYCQKTRHQ
ncbi:MAG: hypothetical protein LBL48_00755 [Azoarcus sp.]|nr:hypothetical protein [Azoarcus sp.]